MDSQSVKTTDRGGLRGFDGFKKVGGRKRHLLTDTLGFVLKAVVHAANVADSVGAKLVLLGLGHWYERLQIIWADQGYRGEELASWVGEQVPATLEVIAGPTKQQIKERAMQEIRQIAQERIRNGASSVEAWAGLSLDEKIAKQYEHLPRRWVVERTFAWLGKNRRLSKDYEYLTDTSQTMIYLAMIRLMLRRLTSEKPIVEKGRNRPKRRAIPSQNT
jgi:putative transposase